MLGVILNDLGCGWVVCHGVYYPSMLFLGMGGFALHFTQDDVYTIEKCPEINEISEMCICMDIKCALVQHFPIASFFMTDNVVVLHRKHAKTLRCIIYVCYLNLLTNY